VQGQLFTQDFLEEGITETEQWRGIDDAAFDRFVNAIRQAYAGFIGLRDPNEATTEQGLIEPVLKELGWAHFLPQQSAARRRTDVPDYLLFDDEPALAQAKRAREPDRYRFGVAILEAKKWERYLDRGREPDLFDDGVPSTQMLRYLSRVEVASDRKIQWGILTNGRHWRLYYQGARSRSEEFLEIDLAVISEAQGVAPDLFSPEPKRYAHWLRVFYLMFRRDAFLRVLDGNRSFHDFALSEGRLWEARVASSLSKEVFEQVFPALARALAANDKLARKPLTPAYLEEVRVAALTLLYRLLFILYAEDRRLLPVHHKDYEGYSLAGVRNAVKTLIDAGRRPSRRVGQHHVVVQQLFEAIHDGDEDLGLPPYNGGLFDRRAHPILARVVIPDSEFAPILDALSRRTENGARKWINYRDLSVQQLGSIYERLLEHNLVLDGDELAVRPNPFARKTSGSYYTHDDLVGLIIEQGVGPLLDERWQEFANLAEALRASRRPKAEKLEELQRLDPATAFLELRVCDPAMGSGHFLVSLVDYLADRALQAIADAEAAVTWADAEQPYHSPLAARIETIRAHIRREAETHKWTVRDEHLDDRQIVRRMILKRVIYGVDKNPMAVELAKVSLWLHTFTVGAPLSFLDHHLRCGDSLFGEWVGPAMREVAERYGLLINPYLAKAQQTVKGMERIEALTDADIAEVRDSTAAFQSVTEDTEPMRRFLDFRHSLRWLGHNNLNGRATPSELLAILDGSFGDPFQVIDGEIELVNGEDAEEDTASLFPETTATQLDLARQSPLDRETRRQAKAMLAEARRIAARERFLHWQVAFPGVWREWESTTPRGGFDAVIGNPPWDRIKLQEVEWFAARRPEIARAIHAAERGRLIEALKQGGDPLHNEYEMARDQAERMGAVARNCGDYPLLSGGDINLYALFVERALQLLHPRGVAGLLVPSGIASDLSTSRFFRSITDENRLSTLFDFRNKRSTGELYFPDVYYRFKFCIFVAGGRERQFSHALCGFQLLDLSEIGDPDRTVPLKGIDFSNVNPNTGTAPIFRHRRDAKITAEIHERVPVLVDRRHEPPRVTWPLRYTRMFDMANDSGLFRTKKQLDEDGYYPVTRNRLKKGDLEYLPLYEGKMVQAFDHRAADIVIAGDNLFRPGQTDVVSEEEHQDPSFLPNPRYFVDRALCQWPAGLNWTLAFKDVTSVTNARTMIAALIPYCGAGHTLPVFFPDFADDNEIRDAVAEYIRYAPCLCANLNSFVFDYLARQKVQGNHLTWFILEQLPLLPAKAYERKLRHLRAIEIISREVLHLTYTADDMAPFARDMGFNGPPFRWDEEDRRHRRARLDAIYFHLYGIDRDDAAYILDTFPIVRREDEARFGCYLTKELILAYMNAVAAGDLETVVAV
jgi:hypothetical protein